MARAKGTNSEVMRNMMLSDIQMDPRLLHLRHVSEFTVSRYRQAYRVGAPMPPILIDKATRRITSGNHRYKAMLQEYGEDYKVNVRVKSYSSRREMLEDFVKENASHGNPLDGSSRTKITLELLREGSTAEALASLFDVSVKRIEEWSSKVANVIDKNGNVEALPVKRGISTTNPIPKCVYNLSEQRDRGITIDLQVEQLERWLQNGLVERNEHTFTLLRGLKKVIEDFLKVNSKSRKRVRRKVNSC